ncbi:MAG: hypothetical protein O7F73_01440 [Gammaproteobacteria bacterium]|nr:hypothetical protein [Gammaproteobacteria bacterium]
MNPKPTINAERLWQRLLQMAQIGGTPAGVREAAGPGALLLNPATPFSANSLRQSVS